MQDRRVVMRLIGAGQVEISRGWSEDTADSDSAEEGEDLAEGEDDLV